MEGKNEERGTGTTTTEGSNQDDEGTFRTLLAKYEDARESVSAVTPKFVKAVELVLAVILILGSAYWAYAYFIVGT